MTMTTAMTSKCALLASLTVLALTAVPQTGRCDYEGRASRIGLPFRAVAVHTTMLPAVQRAAPVHPLIALLRFLSKGIVGHVPLIGPQ